MAMSLFSPPSPSKAGVPPTARRPTRAVPDAASRAARWLALALALHLAGSAAVAVLLMVRGDPIKSSVKATAPGFAAELASEVDADSWEPMLRAHQRARTTGDIYGLFFVDRIKFQYPPSSLLPFELLPADLLGVADEGGIDRRLRWSLTVASWAAMLVTIGASAMLLLTLLPRGPASASWRSASAIVVLSVPLGLTFYPIVRSYDLGQIQIFLNAAAALGLLALARARPGLAGVCFGLCTLMKPQGILILVWGLLRRDWRFSRGFAVVLGLGLAATVFRFGLAAHFRYLEVLQAIARQGEAFWGNQSVNGVLNRLFQNGDALVFSERAFAPYHPVIYGVTLVTSLLIITAALWPSGGPSTRLGRVLDLATMVAAATMASPVAWEHHYGAFLAIFAIALAASVGGAGTPRFVPALLLGSYLLIAGVILRPHWFLVSPSRGLIVSHLFVGALALFGVLLALRRRAADAGDAALVVTGASPTIS